MSVIVILSTPHDVSTARVIVELSDVVGNIMGAGTGVVFDVLPNTDRFQLVNIRINQTLLSDAKYTIMAALGPVTAEANSDPWVVATETLVPLQSLSTAGPRTFGAPTANTVELVIDLPHQTAVTVALRSDQWETALRQELLYGEVSWGLHEEDIVGTGVIVSATGQVSIQLELAYTAPGVADNIMALAEACDLCVILNTTLICPHVIDSQPCQPHMACANPFTCASGMLCKPIPNNEFVDHRCVVMGGCGVAGCTDTGSEGNAATEASISAVNLAMLIALLVAFGCIAAIMGYKGCVLKREPARRKKFGGDASVAASLEWDDVVDELDNEGGWTTKDRDRVSTALAFGKYDELPASRLEGAVISTGSDSDAESNLGSAISWAKESLHGSFDAVPTPGMSPTTNWQASMRSLPVSHEHQMPPSPRWSCEVPISDDECNTYEVAVPHPQPATRSSHHQGRPRRLSAPISTLASLAEDFDPYTMIGDDAESHASSRVQQPHRQLTNIHGATADDFDPYTMIASDAGSTVPSISGGASLARANHRSQIRVPQRSSSLSTLQDGFYDNREFRTDRNAVPQEPPLGLSTMQWQPSNGAGSEASDSTFYHSSSASHGVNLGLNGNSRLQVAASTGTEASNLCNNQQGINLGRNGNSRLQVATSTMRSDHTYDQFGQHGRRLSGGGRRPSQLSGQRGTGLGRWTLTDGDSDAIYDAAGPVSGHGNEPQAPPRSRVHRMQSGLSDDSSDLIYDNATRARTPQNVGAPCMSPTLMMRGNVPSESTVDTRAEAEAIAERMRTIRPDNIGSAAFQDDGSDIYDFAGPVDSELGTEYGSTEWSAHTGSTQDTQETRWTRPESQLSQHVGSETGDSELTYDLAERLFSPVAGISDSTCDL